MDYASRLVGEPSLAAPYNVAPVFVAGSSPAARRRAIALIEGAGLRTPGAVSIGEAVAGLAQRVRTSAVWIELDRDDGEPLDALFDRIDRETGDGHYRAIVSAVPAMIDAVAAKLGGGHVELLIEEGDDSARIAALALATTPVGRGARLADIASDNSGARLRQLTDEVGRIAATLARLSGGPAALTPMAPVAPPHRPTTLRRRLRSTPSARSSARGGCARASSRRICSPIPHGTCCLT